MAITKERLKELIKQDDKKIYWLSKGNSSSAVSVIKEYNNLREFASLILESIDNIEESVFETKEDAEWFLEFGNITRTETLNLPSWEEFNKKYKSKYSPVIAFNGKNPQCFYEMFFKEDDSKEGCVLIYDCDCKEYVYSNRLTKENYIDACKIAKKLWLGE